MLVAIDAGHGMNTHGKRCNKSLDANQTREWVLNARVAELLAEKLTKYGIEYVRVDDVTGKKDVSLTRRYTMANEVKADMYISIHHNAGVNCTSGGGTVVYYYGGGRANDALQLYTEVVKKTGLYGNRVEKIINKGFTVLKKTRMPALLLENGFMDSKVDTPIILSMEHAEKTAEGICKFIRHKAGIKSGYYYNGVCYDKVFNPEYYCNAYTDLKRSFGNNDKELFKHFINFGMKERRQGSKDFNVSVYAYNNPDLKNTFGEDWGSYYKHYCLFGYKENRIHV